MAKSFKAKRYWTPEQSKDWWKAKSVQYPYHAKAPTAIRPEWVEGNHASCVLEIGWRTWGFLTEKERNTFVLQYHAVKM